MDIQKSAWDISGRFFPGSVLQFLPPNGENLSFFDEVLSRLSNVVEFVDGLLFPF